MKRSDMLKKIHREMMHHDLPSWSMAEDILNVIEEEGMLPPCNSPVGCGDFDDECTADHTSDCMWEEE